jgi:hypothetical protein
LLLLCRLIQVFSLLFSDFGLGLGGGLGGPGGGMLGPPCGNLASTQPLPSNVINKQPSQAQTASLLLSNFNKEVERVLYLFLEQYRNLGCD